jgi:hypothetical protein
MTSIASVSISNRTRPPASGRRGRARSVLTRAEAKKEAPRHERGCRGGRLSDHGRMGPDQGAGDPVPSLNRSVAWAIAPMIVQTNELWPCRSVHGWKWSEMSA